MDSAFSKLVFFQCSINSLNPSDAKTVNVNNITITAAIKADFTDLTLFCGRLLV